MRHVCRTVFQTVRLGGTVWKTVLQDCYIDSAADIKTQYNAACVFALATDRRDEPGGTLSKEERAKRAIALLQQAVAKGYKDAEHVKKDDDLNALREPDDFKKLVAELERQAPKK